MNTNTISYAQLHEPGEDGFAEVEIDPSFPVARLNADSFTCRSFSGQGQPHDTFQTVNVHDVAEVRYTSTHRPGIVGRTETILLTRSDGTTVEITAYLADNA